LTIFVVGIEGNNIDVQHKATDKEVT